MEESENLYDKEIIVLLYQHAGLQPTTSLSSVHLFSTTFGSVKTYSQEHHQPCWNHAWRMPIIDNEVLVSYDVNSLFSNIPVEEALAICKTRQFS